jgi:hypothetical protein
MSFSERFLVAEALPRLAGLERLGLNAARRSIVVPPRNVSGRRHPGHDAQAHRAEGSPQRVPGRVMPDGAAPETKKVLQMSQRAIAYARERSLADPDAAMVLLLLAGRTDVLPIEDPLSPMGLLLSDRDIPALAATLNLGADRFRDVLRQLRDLVPMDVLEHRDGTWEIVYGPGYTSPPQPRPAKDGEAIAGRNIFDMPGWEEYSTWGDGRPPRAGKGCLPVCAALPQY